MGSMDAMAIGKKQFLKKFKTGIDQVQNSGQTGNSNYQQTND